MTPDALSHQLTDEERCHFEEHGYLVMSKCSMIVVVPFENSFLDILEGTTVGTCRQRTMFHCEPG